MHADVSIVREDVKEILQHVELSTNVIKDFMEVEMEGFSRYLDEKFV